MTELRDARLRKAMEEAPDAQVQPPARVREAIRAAAHGAVQSPWRRWWPASHAPRGTLRWLALASIAVLVAGVVLSGRWAPSPVQQGESMVAQAPAPAPVPAPPEQAAIAPAPAQPPAPPAAAPAPAPVVTAGPAGALPQAKTEARDDAARAAENARRARAAVLADAAQARREASARAAPSGERSAVVAAAPPPAVPDALAKAAESEARSEAAPARAAQDAASVAAAPPPPLAQGPAPRAAAPAAPAAAVRAGPPALPWTQVRIESGGRSVVVPRMQAAELAPLITSMLGSPSEPADPGPPGSLRLELAQGDESAGVLEVVGDRWRWISLREGGRPRLLKPDAGVAAALKDEAERLLRQ
jgi:hypothetical protein